MSKDAPFVATILPPETRSNREITHSVGSVSSDLGPISVDIFRSSARVRSPAVFFLHGAFGLTPNYLPLIRYLAGRGYLVFAPNFFSRTGTSWAKVEVSRENFFPWLGILIDAFGNLRSHDEVDPRRIGMMGISLGASLALALAAQLPGVRAVVEFFGHVPRLCLISAMPPTMIVHGGSDRHVHPRDALRLAESLRARSIPCELNIFPLQRHVIRGPAFLEAVKRTAEFLDTHLEQSA